MQLNWLCCYAAWGEIIFDVSVDSRQCLTDTSKSNSTLGTHLHAMIRTRHFDFNVSF